jgi:hypothetical protein
MKKELEQKKEKGSHWADPGTGPAQQPPNQPTRGPLLPSLSFTFSLFYFYADGRDPPVSIIFSNGYSSLETDEPENLSPFNSFYSLP